MARTEVTGSQIKDGSVDLAVDVTGILPVANGGTGSTTLTLNSVLLGNGTGALQAVAPGSAGNVLTSNGTSWVSSAVAGTGDTSTNTTTSVDSEVALFSGTGGKSLKRATGSGLALLTSGVLSTVTAPSGAVVGTTDTQALSNKDLTSSTNTFPTFNQDTTGSAARLTTARTINGVSFDGTANITVADSTKEPTITAGTTGQYWRGDKSWQTLDKAAVGLSNVDNTSDASKPVSTATQTALDAKEPTLTAGTAAQYYRGDKSWATLNAAAVSGAEATANKGQPGGYASLDGGGKVPVSQLPNAIMEYQGSWNASTNTPTLANGTGSPGDVYRVSVAGTQLGLTFEVGDYAIYNGTTWEKSDATDAVTSVNGYTGAVSLTKSDVGLGSVDNTADANKNVLSATKWTTARTLAGNSVDGSANVAFTNNFIVQGTTDSGLSGAQFLGALATGLLKNTTTTGVLSIAISGTDYAPATSGSAILKGSGSGGFLAAAAGTDYVAPGGALGTPSSGNLANCTFPTLNQNTTGSAGSVTNALTFNNAGTGAVSGTTYNGSAAQTISYNTVGASPLAGSASLTTTGTVTSGTWSGAFGAVSGANLTNLTAGNLSGTIPSAVLGNSSLFIGTTSVALNRASSALTLAGVSLTAPTLTGTTVNAQNGIIESYNTADQTTNYEKVVHRWNTNVAEIASLFGGTGTARAVTIGVSSGAGNTTVGRSLTIQNAVPFISCSSGGSGAGSTAINGTHIRLGNPSTQFTASSTFQTVAAVSGNIGQSGTASYTGLLVDITETTTGSGTKHLINAQVGGSPKFTVDNAGAITSNGVAVPTISSADTFTNKTISGSSNTFTNIPLSGLASAAYATANTASTLVQRDASGNFSAGTVTAALSGNAATATKLLTARSITLTGAVSGTTATSFDGSANASIATTVSTTQGGVVYGSSATAYATTGTATAGYLLASGNTAAPTWVSNDLTAFPSSAFKQAVKAATTADLGTVTYANGTSGVGATITGPSGASAVVFPAQDGITLALGDRLLVKDQNSAAQNGIYKLTTVGVAATTAWVLTRATDADTSDEIAGALIPVDQGTTNGGQLYTATFKPTDTMGTTAMPYYRVYTTADATTAATASKLVLRDASGNFSAGTVTAALSGNATTATTATYASTVGTDGHSNPVNIRYLRNANTAANNDGMYIGYGNSNSGATRLYGGGDTTNPVQVTTGGALSAPSTVQARAFMPLVTSTATAAGTTTLTIASNQVQVFTGTTTQTVVLPTTSVTAGMTYTIVNQSSGVLTVQSSALTTLATINANATGIFTARVSTPTAITHWIGTVMDQGNVLTMNANLALAGVDGKTLTVNNSLTLAGTDNTVMTFPSASGTVMTADSTVAAVSNKNFNAGTGNTWPTFNQNTTGSAATLSPGRTIQTDLSLTTAATFTGAANVTPGVTGTLAVANGGTGVATLTGMVKANGTADFSAAVAGTDYMAPASTIIIGTTSMALNRASGQQTIAGLTLTSPTISSITNTGTLTLPTSTDTLVGRNTTDTLTNKRITPRVTTSNAPGATPAVDWTLYDQINYTGLAAAITSMTTGLVAGTPSDGQRLMLRFKDNGTARTITWGASYTASGNCPLLSTTLASKTHLCSFIYDSAAAKWVAMATDEAGY